ncbi:hypothetical protein OPKNFCMD_6659 [Methylobacterium crusticola]|uniref:Stability/partitioning determinant n=1 Tax=Methylobacterium crusticola TaxID=1697972 RepID=A0ABQ4R828_9HYPH|nr:hypothetical protein [Methylobacterium crusticola]GJD53880.1 hypothetical protein OPKNFCMD_6659 [Methylobacterium crusticola]
MNRPVPAGLASLSDFRPSSASPETAEPAATSTKAIAEAHGFVERNPVTIRKRRKPTEEPTYSFTARVSVRSANAFIEWCERERMSYREGFDRLVAKID